MYVPRFNSLRCYLLVPSEQLQVTELESTFQARAFLSLIVGLPECNLLKAMMDAERQIRLRMQDEKALQDNLAHELEAAVRHIAAHRWKVDTMIGAMETVLLLFERPRAFALLQDKKDTPGGFYREVGNEAAHPTFDRELMQDALDFGLMNFDSLGKDGLIQLFGAMNDTKPARSRHPIPDQLQGSDLVAGLVGFRNIPFENDDVAATT